VELASYKVFIKINGLTGLISRKWIFQLINILAGKRPFLREYTLKMNKKIKYAEIAVIDLNLKKLENTNLLYLFINFIY
jgi:hypothetical protein